MSKRKDQAQLVRDRQLAQHLAHMATITYTLDGVQKTARVQWFGYPAAWASWNMDQRIEWWRQHCVRMFAMPMTATLDGVQIICS